MGPFATTEPETTNAVGRYGDILAEYLHTHSENALYQASIISKQFVETGMGPEEIIPIHFDALERGIAAFDPREQARALGDAHQFLIEVMIAYGVKYREYLELRVRESLHEAETRARIEWQRALDAERGEQERGALLATIAHELRSPLSAAMGNIDLARRSLTRGQPEVVPPLLDSSRTALDRLSRLSGDLVQASRGTRPQLTSVAVDMDKLLAQVCAWVRPTAEAQGLAFAGPEGGGGRLLADADALLSVFGNLLANAVRYTPAGGRIAVRHGVADGQVWVEVEDTGIGMSDEVQARIFQRFYRAPDAAVSDLGGLGLGLALAWDLVVAHAGSIEVRSAAGEGSTFRVTLPANAGGGGGTSPARGEPAARMEAERGDQRLNGGIR